MREGIVRLAIKFIFKLIIILLLLLPLIRKMILQKRKDENTKNGILHAYESKPLLTKYEWENYQELRNYATEKGLSVNVKVRLADLISPKNDIDPKLWRKRFNKISSKHVDFVICDQDMNVKLIVELDDWSHQRPDRQERDKFVDAALTGAGYKIVHIYAFDEDGRETLESILSPPDQELLEDIELAAQIHIDKTIPTYEEWRTAKFEKLQEKENH